MLNFISFGSGSSGNCYFLYTGTDALMIDAGIGIRQLKKHFAKFGLSPAAVHNILVTHDHADHIKSVGCFSTDYNVPVFTTQKVHKGINRNYSVRVKVPEENVRVIEKDVETEIGEFRITPFAVPHDSSDNVGYMIKHGSAVFCLMTDIGHIAENLPASIAAADYLVIEANHDRQMLWQGPYPDYLKERIAGPVGHLSNEECAGAITKYGSERLKHVWLCHLSQDNNHPELARKTVEQAMQNVGMTERGVVLDVLKRRTPQGIWQLDD